MHVMQNSTSEMRNFLRLPIEIQKIIVLKNPPNLYDGWRLDNKGDNINIYIDKSMYYVDPRHYHDQIEKINLICFRWPTSLPRLILDCSFNHWILNIMYHVPQDLNNFFDWANQIVGDLNYHKMIYDFTPSFVPKPRQSGKLIQKLNHHFSHTRSRFPSLLSHEKSTRKLSSKAIRTHFSQFHIDKSNPHFIERYHNDKYVRLLQENPCKIMSQVFSSPMEIQEIIAMYYFNNRKSETWMLKFNGPKVIVEIDAKEMWMELELEMSVVHLFCMIWPYHRPNISLNCVDHVNVKYWG